MTRIEIPNNSNIIVVKFPFRLISEANNTEHWTKKYKRKKNLKNLIHIHLKDIIKPKLPCKIILTRIAPRKLDYDNLCLAQKHCLDYICDWLIPGLQPGRADGDKRIFVEYKQEKRNTKEYGVKIEIISISKDSS